MYIYKGNSHELGARMKTLILIISLILVVTQKIQACDGLQEPKIQEVVAAAAELSAHVGKDSKFLLIKDMSSEKQKKINEQWAMQPINFADQKHQIDQFALGDLVVESNVIGGAQKIEGSAYKVGKSCIVTAAHVLYPTTNQEMSESNKAAYKGSIKFVRGNGVEKIETSASIFFQMTKADDYSVVDGKRHFKGNSDIVILKLNNYQDNYFKTIKVASPEELLKNVDYKIGRKVTCMGSPSHMTQKKYGTCNGNDFKWKQENARIFSEDKSTGELGIATNAAFSPGMSGGACFLAENTNQVIGLAVNGYLADENGTLTMPNINMESTDTSEKNQRHIATFNKLDQRMKSELGYGIEELEKYCK